MHFNKKILKAFRNFDYIIIYFLIFTKNNFYLFFLNNYNRKYKFDVFCFVFKKKKFFKKLNKK